MALFHQIVTIGLTSFIFAAVLFSIFTPITSQSYPTVDGILQWLAFSWIGRAILLFLGWNAYDSIRPGKSLTGKTILITGGAEGLGKEIALQAAKLGANIVLWDINRTGVQATADAIKSLKLGTKVHYFVVDVADRKSVYETAKKTKEEVGFVYCLINNAGLVSGKTILENPDEHIERVISVNTLAHFWTIKAFLPDMIAKGEGHICAIASAAGLFGAPKLIDYCASKFALLGLDEGLRQELFKLGKSHIRTSIICPGHILTDLFDGYNPGFFQRSLTTKEVAFETLDAIRKNKEVVKLPEMVYLACILKAILPTFLNDIILLITTTSRAMDVFKGKPVSQTFGRRIN